MNQEKMTETAKSADAQPQHLKPQTVKRTDKANLSGSIVNMAESASIKFVLQVSGSCSRQLATCSSQISIREGTFIAVRDHRTIPSDHTSTCPHTIAAC